MSTTPLTSFTSPEINALTIRYLELRQQRDQLEIQMQQVLDSIKAQGVNPKPSYHCRRCGHSWFGLISRRPPRNCPRCHSGGWMEEPKLATARRPGDPPNPKWHVRKGEELPEPPRHPETRTRKSELEPPTSNRQITHQEVDGLAPPPKLADVLPAAVVPPASVRFAEDQPNVDSNDKVEPESK